jgi:uncharacterized DUF497 family protein
MNLPGFEWDEGNREHVLADHPERGNTIEEVESVFYDPWLTLKLNRIVNEEERFMAVGEGAGGTIRVVVFIFQNDLIRPISCWEANKKVKSQYYEARQKKDIRN